MSKKMFLGMFPKSIVRYCNVVLLLRMCTVHHLDKSICKVPFKHAVLHHLNTYSKINPYQETRTLCVPAVDVTRCTCNLSLLPVSDTQMFSKSNVSLHCLTHVSGRSVGVLIMILLSSLRILMMTETVLCGYFLEKVKGL